MRSGLDSLPLALGGQRPPIYSTNLTNTSTQPKCLLICLDTLNLEGTSRTGCRSSPASALPLICDLSIHLRRDSRLDRIHAVGDSGGNLQNFSLPSRRSPCQVERGASTVSAKRLALSDIQSVPIAIAPATLLILAGFLTPAALELAELAPS